MNNYDLKLYQCNVRLGGIAFGHSMNVLIQASIWLLTWIASVAYCVLVGDLIKPTVCYIGNIDDNTCSNLWLRRVVITICILLVSPFCYMTQVTALKYTSIVSILSVTVLSGIITSYTIKHLLEDHTIYFIDADGNSQDYIMSTHIDLLPQDWKDVVYVFPIFGLSYLCHFNIPQVHAELTRPTRKRIRKVITAVVLLTTLLYCIVSIFGYFYAFEYTCGNILLNYDQNDPVVTIGRLCLGLVLLFTFPLLILPARASLHNLLNSFCHCKGMNMDASIISSNASDVNNDHIINNINNNDNSISSKTITVLAKHNNSSRKSIDELAMSLEAAPAENQFSLDGNLLKQDSNDFIPKTVTIIYICILNLYYLIISILQYIETQKEKESFRKSFLFTIKFTITLSRQ